MNSRRFKVRGQNLIGTETSREGSRVTLMAVPPNWPFVSERVFDRSELVRLDVSNSDDEPKAAPKARRGRVAA